MSTATATAPTQLHRIEEAGFYWWVREGVPSDLSAIREVAGERCYFTRAFRVEPGERWLDAGANIGAFAVTAAAAGAVVTAYEPEPDNADLARRNLEENGQPGAVVEKAVALRGGFARLGLSRSAWRHSLLRPRGAGMQVPVVSFADAITGMDAAKLDIEGAEIELLAQVEDFGSLRKLVFEWHFDHERNTDIYLAVVERLRWFWPEVRGRKVKPHTRYVWFPPAALVRCWR